MPGMTKHDLCIMTRARRVNPCTFYKEEYMDYREKYAKIHGVDPHAQPDRRRREFRRKCAGMGIVCGRKKARNWDMHISENKDVKVEIKDKDNNSEVDDSDDDLNFSDNEEDDYTIEDVKVNVDIKDMDHISDKVNSDDDSDDDSEEDDYTIDIEMERENFRKARGIWNRKEVNFEQELAAEKISKRKLVCSLKECGLLVDKLREQMEGSRVLTDRAEEETRRQRHLLETAGIDLRHSRDRVARLELELDQERQRTHEDRRRQDHIERVRREDYERGRHGGGGRGGQGRPGHRGYHSRY